MGLAVAAELNGYPGPGHLLEFAESLELPRSRQLSGISRVFVQTAPLPISLSGSGAMSIRSTEPRDSSSLPSRRH